MAQWCAECSKSWVTKGKYCNADKCQEKRKEEVIDFLLAEANRIARTFLESVTLADIVDMLKEKRNI